MFSCWRPEVSPATGPAYDTTAAMVTRFGGGLSNCAVVVAWSPPGACQICPSALAGLVCPPPVMYSTIDDPWEAGLPGEFLEKSWLNTRGKPVVKSSKGAALTADVGIVTARVVCPAYCT